MFNKYHNKKLDTPDGKFDSKYEYQKWCELKLLEKAGEISSLKRQVKLELIPKIKTNIETFRSISYYADFMYIDGDKKIIYESKGYKTKEYLIKKRLLINKYVLVEGYIFIEESNNKKNVYKYM